MQWTADVESHLRKAVLTHTVDKCTRRGIRVMQKCCGSPPDNICIHDDFVNTIVILGQRFRRLASVPWGAVRAQYNAQTAGDDLFDLIETIEGVLICVEFIVHKELNSHDVQWLDKQQWGSDALRKQARKAISDALWDWARACFAQVHEIIHTIPSQAVDDELCTLCSSFVEVFRQVPNLIAMCREGARVNEAFNLPAWQKLEYMFLPSRQRNIFRPSPRSELTAVSQGEQTSCAHQ